MKKTYRRPSLLHLSLFGMLFFAAGAIFCLVYAIFAPRDEIPWAGMFWWLTIPCLLFLGFFVWAVRTTLKCRLEVTDDGVILIGLRHTRRVRFQNLASAQWQSSIWSGGVLVLSTATDEIVVRFENYGLRKLEDIKELIRFFHNTIPNHLQKDWDGSVCEATLHAEPTLFE